MTSVLSNEADFVPGPAINYVEHKLLSFREWFHAQCKQAVSREMIAVLFVMAAMMGVLIVCLDIKGFGVFLLMCLATLWVAGANDDETV